MPLCAWEMTPRAHLPLVLPYFFLFGRCVRAEPAAVFEFLPVLLLFRTLEAAVPARLGAGGLVIGGGPSTTFQAVPLPERAQGGA